MIDFEHVTKRYGTTRALDDVSFTIARGGLTFLVGPSGSGKTTVLRLLTRELRPDEGSVRIGGADVGRLATRKVPGLRRLVAVVPQDLRLLANRSVADNIGFALSVLGWPGKASKERVAGMLDMVGLAHKADNLPGELSGGERQRVAIARAMAGSPVVLLADEPTGNLDPATSVGIVRLLESVAKLGTTVVMSTHDQSIVDAMRAQVIALESGRVARIERGGYVGAQR